MPGTHLLPPNLLKLFAPRPPLPYTRPLDRDIDRVHPKNVSGVGLLLAKLREEKTQGMINSGEGEGMEEGEEPTFTHAEETKRAIRREDRKKKKTEEFKQAKETCTYIVCLVFVSVLSPPTTDKPADDPEAIGDPYKTLFIARLVQVPSHLCASISSLFNSTKARPKTTYAASLKDLVASNG